MCTQYSQFQGTRAPSRVHKVMPFSVKVGFIKAVEAMRSNYTVVRQFRNSLEVQWDAYMAYKDELQAKQLPQAPDSKAYKDLVEDATYSKTVEHTGIPAQKMKSELKRKTVQTTIVTLVVRA